VQMYQETVEDDLEALGVAVHGKPDDYVKYGIDEKSFEVVLQRVVGYRNRSTLLNDLDSVAAIVRLRKGKHPLTLETSLATLLTDNSSLRHAAQTLNGSRRQWDLVTLDTALGTLLWLKQPTLAPSLPLVRIAADCLSALTPSKAFWEDFIVEVDKQVSSGTISANDAVALRSTIEAQHAIVVNTGGNPAMLSAISVTKVRDQVVGALTAPVVERLDETAEALEVAHRHATELEKQLTDLRLRETRLRVSAKNTSRRWIDAVRGIVGVLLFVCVGVTSVVQLWPVIVSLPGPWSILLGVVVVAGSVAVAVCATYGIYAIPTVREWLTRREASIERFVLRSHQLTPIAS